VLLIHGYFVIANAGDATWTTFRKNLIQDGWPEEYLFTPSFQDVRGCNEDHVNEIEAWVEDIRAKTGWDKIDIVCHSFGCLNTLTWLKERCGVNRVRQFVAMAGAVHGTWVACADDVVGLSCAGHQMCIKTGQDGWKSNDLLVQVNACDETPGNVGYTTVWSTYDEIIRPPEGCQMAGARNIEVATKFVEHGGIFLCDECYGHVKSALTDGGLNEDGPGWGCFPQCIPPEVADPPPEVAEEADVPAVDAAGEVPDVPAIDAAEVAPEDLPATDVATDDGGTPDRSPDAATGDEGVTADGPAGDAPDAAADVPAPARKSGGCSVGAAGTATGVPFALLLALAMLAFAAPSLRSRER
jgi:pimeloyl-ACP methyl ester carboxylesterase